MIMKLNVYMFGCLIVIIQTIVHSQFNLQNPNKLSSRSHTTRLTKCMPLNKNRTFKPCFLLSNLYLPIYVSGF